MVAAQQQSVFALIAQRLVFEQRAHVEPDVLGVIGEGVDKFLERHETILSFEQKKAWGGCLPTPLRGPRGQGSGGRLQDFLALMPVARAQLVGMERVEHAGRLGRVARSEENTAEIQ